MCNELGGISHLDRALNAAIVLSYIALRQGDNVGFLAFSNRAERWVRPVRGAGAIQTIILRNSPEVTAYALPITMAKLATPMTSTVGFHSPSMAKP